MDNVEFDILMEATERRLRQKADEIGVTRQKLLTGGLITFDTGRLCNDLEKIIEGLKQAAPEAFIQTYPVMPDASGGAVIDTTE